MSEPAAAAVALAPERHSLSLIWSLAPGTLLAGVAGGIAFPILPIVAAQNGLPLFFIGIILAANRAMRLICSPLVGWFADRVGGRRMLLFGLVIQIAVLLLYFAGVVTHAVGPFFLGGRLLHGPGSAGVFVSAQALALQASNPKESGRAVGAVRASIVLGIPIGLAAGGLLSDALGDARTFLVAAAAVLAALVVAFVRVPDVRVPAKRRTTLGETLRAVRDRRLFAVGALNFALNFAAGGMILTTLALLVRERHLSLFGRNEQGTSGLLMGIMIVVDAATTQLTVRLGDRFRAHARVAAGAIVLLVAGLVTVGLSVRVPSLAAGLALVGLGAAGLGPSLLLLMGELVPPDRRGTGVGLLQFCGDCGGMLGPLVGTALFAGSAVVPYLVTAGLVAACGPLAIWLARLEAAAAFAPERGDSGTEAGASGAL